MTVSAVTKQENMYSEKTLFRIKIAEIIHFIPIYFHLRTSVRLKNKTYLVRDQFFLLF